MHCEFDSHLCYNAPMLMVLVIEEPDGWFVASRGGETQRFPTYLDAVKHVNFAWGAGAELESAPKLRFRYTGYRVQ
jgi:hypothetical protein